MLLENLDLTARKKLTSQYPVLFASETGSGKSYAFAQLEPAEKKRTVIFNFDNKAISDDDSEFLFVYHSFDIKDLEMVDKIEANIYKTFASDKVDRILLDTFTLMTKLFNRWAAEHYSGFDVWNAYNNSITRIIECVKSCTLTYGKFSYVTAHYPPRLGHTPGTKRYVTTKGKEHTNVVEESFSTVVETIMEDRKFKYCADVFSENDTTKTKLVEGHFKFVRKSVDDLEQVLTKSKTIVDEQVV
jgi:hypothetical protein